MYDLCSSLPKRLLTSCGLKIGTNFTSARRSGNATKAWPCRSIMAIDPSGWWWNNPSEKCELGLMKNHEQWKRLMIINFWINVNWDYIVEKTPKQWSPWSMLATRGYPIPGSTTTLLFPTSSTKAWPRPGVSRPRWNPVNWHETFHRMIHYSQLVFTETVVQLVSTSVWSWIWSGEMQRASDIIKSLTTRFRQIQGTHGDPDGRSQVRSEKRSTCEEGAPTNSAIQKTRVNVTCYAFVMHSI